MTTDEALALCRDSWGRGAFVMILATSKTREPDLSRAYARAQLVALQATEPAMWFAQEEDCPSDMTMGEFRSQRVREHAQFSMFSAEERRLRQIAFPERFVVGTADAIDTRYERGEGDTWEEALRSARVLGPTLSERRAATEKTP